ncbi:glycosyltransferase family 4 protein [Microvirga thermotolerans]|nr:glycosyltransferase family 4 protein [Microvirga thermotolerans]
MTADAVGGVWQYALDLSAGLCRKGAQVVLAVLGPDPSPAQKSAAEAAGVDLIATGLPLDWIAQDAAEVEAAGRAVAELAGRTGADIVHLNNPALAASADFAAPIVSICHSCVATWWRSVRGGALPEEFVWRTELVRRGYAASALLLAPTKAFALATQETYGLSGPPRVVRNGRRPAQVEGSPTADPFVFTAGRLWDEGKNFSVLDRAAARLSIPVIAAGALEGPNGARVEASHARVLGSVTDDEVARHLGLQPIFASAALYEPFGLAVLEAAQAGCALVLSDIPTFRELWGEAAEFVPPDDPEAFAKVVEELAGDEERRRRMGEAAKARSRAYSVDAMCAGVMTAYGDLLSTGIARIRVEDAAA